MFNQDHVAPIKPNPRVPSSSDGLGRTRPQGVPKSDKDFRRLIRDDDSDSDHSDMALKEKDSKDNVGNEELESNTSTPSLFDLAKKTNPMKKDTAMDSSLLSQMLNQPEEEPNLLADAGEEVDNQLVDDNLQKPLDVAGQLAPNTLMSEEATKEARLAAAKQARGRSDALAMDTDATAFSPKDKSKKLKSDMRSDFSQEHTDIAYVNPLGQRSSEDVDAYVGNGEQMTSHSATIKELIDKVAEHIQVIKQSDQTQTIVTLKYPPILEGSNLSLTSLDSAKGQFNIAFTNLTEQAKLFLDRKLVGDALTFGLEQRGFVVYNIITSTSAEIPNIQEQADKFARGGQQQQQQQQQQRQPQDEEQT